MSRETMRTYRMLYTMDEEEQIRIDMEVVSAQVALDDLASDWVDIKQEEEEEAL